MENKRKITVELIFDLDEWQDYEDVTDELMVEDSGIYDNLKDGIKVNILWD